MGGVMMGGDVIVGGEMAETGAEAGAAGGLLAEEL